ncbi:response regulator [Halarchaeum sp. CBA1220]|uniref:response regulator n=1 Tax=Halarchaeum sp. CBA1220 TaxID=1853682 RepID=UPI0011CDE41B|nr:response regulator [Halarchaeum sp. CBA1220]QLC34084.1 response regulator [Halarchaeum sp. CBA1220]
MSEYTILWIDDDKERRETGRGGVGDDERVDVIPCDPMELASRILSDEGKDFPEPDLALVDWYLHTGDYAGDGPSIEGILRDKYPEIPIYAFSSNYDDGRFKRERKQGESRFALITSPDRLRDEDIIHDLQDYEQIREQEGEGIDGILNLFDIGGELQEKIESTLPQEFINGIPSKDSYEPGSILRFARWVRHELLEKPGLLWDDVWTATKVGIDVRCFDQYQDQLFSARYTGIFSHRIDRWWRELVRDQIYTLAAEQETTVSRTWQDGPDLLDIPDSDRSECQACNDDEHTPQTVAAGKPGEQAEFQVHYRCSDIEKSRESTFEDFRMMVKL